MFFIMLAETATAMLQVVGKGLSALTEAQLALPLDKSLQCSSWGSRPLTPAQVTSPHAPFLYGLGQREAWVNHELLLNHA